MGPYNSTMAISTGFTVGLNGSNRYFSIELRFKCQTNLFNRLQSIKTIPRRPCKFEKDVPLRRANKIMRFICNSLYANPNKLGRVATKAPRHKQQMFIVN